MKSTTEAGEFSTSDLKELQGQLNVWRRQQRKRAGLPEGVWIAAAALALRLGVSRVSRALRLNFFVFMSVRQQGCELCGRVTAFVLWPQFCWGSQPMAGNVC